MNLRTLVITALAAGTTSSALQAQVTQLTFEGLADHQVIGDYYNGGPGGSLGVTFGGLATAYIAYPAGGSGYFQRAPSAITAMQFGTTTNAVINLASGFSTAFSLFYSGIHGPAVASVYSGANGTGSLLATLDLPMTPSELATPACPDFSAFFCPFVAANVTFAGTGHSVVFTGDLYDFIDNVTFGSANPLTTTTPEPASIALMVTGLVAVAAVRRRRRSAA